jgi:hypothetical protein
MRFTTLALALLAAAGGTPRIAARAQQSAPVAIGERVRLTTSGADGRSRHVGRVVGVGDDSVTLQLRDASETRALALSRVTRVEVSAGRRTHVRRGMLYGTVAGAGAGALVGAITYKKGRGPACSPNDILFCGFASGDAGVPDQGVSPRAGATLGALFGFLAGGIGGRFYRTERWIHRPSSTGATVGVRPSANGPVVQVSLWR